MQCCGCWEASLVGDGVDAPRGVRARGCARIRAGAVLCGDVTRNRNRDRSVARSDGCVTLQGVKCNFKLRTLGILNLLALGALGPGLEVGI